LTLYNPTAEAAGYKDIAPYGAFEKKSPLNFMNWQQQKSP
jgi:hypothetical protein